MAKVKNKNGVIFDFDKIMNDMNLELRCEVADMMQLSSDQEFFDVYCKEHFKKFGEEWEIAAQ